MRNDEASVFAQLRHVAEHRRVFRPLFDELAHREFNRLPADGPIVEIGSGDGQFSRLLAERFADRAHFSEPTELGVTLLRRAGLSPVHRASAESLPFADASVAAIVGCCILDLLPDLSLAFAEFRRVLRPGGRVLHLLDMSPDMTLLVREVVEHSNLCLLPNVFTDPVQTPWPEDLFAVPRPQLDLILEILDDHPAASQLARLRQAYRVSAEAAWDAFIEIHSSTEGRRHLRQAFRHAMATAGPEQQRRLVAFEGRPLSSARIFNDRATASAVGFQVDCADLVRHQHAEVVESGGGAYRSIVGFTQTGQPSEASTGTVHLELGVHRFALSKHEIEADLLAEIGSRTT